MAGECICIRAPKMTACMFRGGSTHKPTPVTWVSMFLHCGTHDPGPVQVPMCEGCLGRWTKE